MPTPAASARRPDRSGTTATRRTGLRRPSVEVAPPGEARERLRSPYDEHATEVIRRPAAAEIPAAPAVDARPPAPADEPWSPARTATTRWHRPGTAPIVIPADTPRRPWKVVTRTLSKAWDDSLFGMSAEAAFWQALSTAPLLLALLGSIGFVGGWFGPGTIDSVEDRVVTVLRTVFSPEVSSTLIEPTVDSVLHQGQADVVSVGFVISLWAGSSAMASFVESITIAYNQHEVRHPVTERFFALGLYLCALVFGVFALPLLAVGPEYLPEFFPDAWHAQVTRIVGIAYYPGIALLLIVALATLYKLAPRHRHPWRRGLPGAVLAAGVFIVASAGLRAYLGYVTTHGLTYGALATPIAFMLFAYFVGIAIIIGAQFNNATLEYYPPRRSRRELRKWRRLDAESA
ncbi:YihY/virulence factor BrkB family protein [Nakamurella deserti]|uniref:YihY/virulence factor BrkB family protein n=1 Tax=Nakamurella deserti TaxID=2164074 RepID=UPI000DBE251E|nr:YihY/virulence factor BrkB family protein [Nakamurella deserti]